MPKFTRKDMVGIPSHFMRSNLAMLMYEKIAKEKGAEERFLKRAQAIHGLKTGEILVLATAFLQAVFESMTDTVDPEDLVTLLGLEAKPLDELTEHQKDLLNRVCDGVVYTVNIPNLN